MLVTIKGSSSGLESLPMTSTTIGSSFGVDTVSSTAEGMRRGIGITGSNGKTIVKEWLNFLLSPDYSIIRSPKSYNSQVGVPLSVIGINEQHNLGIFEAGISTVSEMEKLETIIRPTIGVLTNIGSAHDEGFSNTNEKIKEKLRLLIVLKF